jgi:hypothetical protein
MKPTLRATGKQVILRAIRQQKTESGLWLGAGNDPLPLARVVSVGDSPDIKCKPGEVVIPLANATGEVLFGGEWLGMFAADAIGPVVDNADELVATRVEGVSDAMRTEIQAEMISRAKLIQSGTAPRNNGGRHLRSHR